MIPDSLPGTSHAREELLKAFAERLHDPGSYGGAGSNVSLHRGCGLEAFECDESQLGGRASRSDSGILKIQDLISPGPAVTSGRLVDPLLRDPAGALVPIDWPQALQEFSARFKALQERHGPQSVAFLCPGQIATEELALLGLLTRIGMGITRGAHAVTDKEDAAAIAYTEAFGFDAPPYSFSDLEESDTIVLIGFDLSLTHPQLWERVQRNAHHPTVIVIDPRSTETARQATLHLPVEAGSERILLQSIARELIERDWIDRDYVARHTEGFPELAEQLESFTVDVAARETRLSVGLIEHLIELVHRGERVSFWWSPEQVHGPGALALSRAVINLALMTGNIGRPGTGANALGSPSNGNGARLFGNLFSLPGGRTFDLSEHRLDAAKALGLPPGRLPEEAGASGEQILRDIDAGVIRGLWLIGTSSGDGWSDSLHLQETLRKLDCLVVQDTRLSAPAVASAHLVLPGAEWGEKRGTFITQERRLKSVPKHQAPPGRALTDLTIFRLLASAWGCGGLVRRWTTADSAFEILKALSSGQPCDFTGVRDFTQLEEAIGVQWPCARGQDRVGHERRLFEEGRFYHPDGRARFTFDTPHPRGEKRLLDSSDKSSVAEGALSRDPAA